MKKIFRNKFMLAALVLGVMTSCTENDDATLDTRAIKPLVSIGSAAYSVTEGESFTVTLTSDKAINTTMDFKLELVDGNGSFRDFVVEGVDETTPDEGAGFIGQIIVMPAYATTHTFTVTPIIDLDVEGTETFVFALTSARNSRGLVADGSGTITATVADYVSNDVGVELTWDGNTFNYFGNIVEGEYITLNANGEPTPAAFTDFDFDLYIISAASFDEVTEYAGATGNSPEMAVISEDLPDGDYLLIADLFEAGDEPVEPFVHNLSMKVSKFGNWSVTIPIPGYGSDHADSAPNGLDGGETIVATLTKTGTTYVLKNEAGDVLAQGRMSAIANKFKSRKVRK